MKNCLLILLMLILPLQSFAAAERHRAHVFGADGGAGRAALAAHLAEHDAHVPHHHETPDQAGHDDGEGMGTHVDSSHESIKHLADVDHGCGLHILLPTFGTAHLPAVDRFVPVLWPDVFSNRTTVPLLPPPRPIA